MGECSLFMTPTLSGASCGAQVHRAYSEVLWATACFAYAAVCGSIHECELVT
ncbi:hypothetical protein AB0885_27120 [Streptomyces sp. NPDC005534]|uniref:hypothetical protein n=1 Tax=Streptomyces sp. NPDC005534 TaxID=3155714 RepID=UPI0034529E9C